MTDDFEQPDATKTWMRMSSRPCWRLQIGSLVRLEVEEDTDNISKTITYSANVSDLYLAKINQIEGLGSPEEAQRWALESAQIVLRAATEECALLLRKPR